MPRNRQEVQRDEKVDDIVRAGAEILRSAGYAGLSVQAVAERLGVARGAIYWYFPSKDGLFAASAASAITEALQNPPRSRTATTEIMWAVERLAELQPVHTALQERARYSPEVAAFLAELRADLLGRLRALLRHHLHGATVESVAGVIFIYIQGTLSIEMTPADRERHLRFLLRRLLGRDAR